MSAWIQLALCIIMSLLLALFLDVSAGGFLIAFFLLSGIFSGLSVLIFRKSIGVSLSSDCILTEQGEEFTLTAILKRTDSAWLLKFLPMPFVTVNISHDGGIYNDKPLSFTVMPGWSREIKIPRKVMGLYCGKSEISLGEIILSDFFGLFRISVFNNSKENKLDVAVFPTEYELEKDIPLMQKICAEASFSDSEETAEEFNLGAGLPGYESREYQPGDSLKRVNWKLSARRAEYWVRKEEFSSKNRQVFVLDGAAFPEKSEAAAFRGLILETVLSVGISLLKQDIPVELYRFHDGMWESSEFSGMENIGELRSLLAETGFKGESRFPESVEGDSAVTLFTLCPDCEATRYVGEVSGSDRFSSMIFAGGKSADGWRAVRSDGQISLESGGGKI